MPTGLSCVISISIGIGVSIRIPMIRRFNEYGIIDQRWHDWTKSEPPPLQVKSLTDKQH